MPSYCGWSILSICLFVYLLYEKNFSVTFQACSDLDCYYLRFFTKSMKKLMLLWLSTEDLEAQTDCRVDADEGQNWTSLSRNEHSGSKSSESRSRLDSKLLPRFLSTTVFGSSSSSLSSSVDVWGPPERLSGSTSSGVVREASLATFGNVALPEHISLAEAALRLL